MNPACVAMRPKLDVLMALLVDSLPNFAVLVRLRISNRISPTGCPPNRVSFDEHQVDVLAELIQGAVDRSRRVAVLADAGVRERRRVEISRVGIDGSTTTRSSSLPVVFGSPIRFGRCRPPKRPRLASDVPLLSTAFSGEPLTISTIADAFHPPASA